MRLPQPKARPALRSRYRRPPRSRLRTAAAALSQTSRAPARSWACGNSRRTRHRPPARPLARIRAARTALGPPHRALQSIESWVHPWEQRAGGAATGKGAVPPQAFNLLPATLAMAVSAALRGALIAGELRARAAGAQAQQRRAEGVRGDAELVLAVREREHAADAVLHERQRCATAPQRARFSCVGADRGPEQRVLAPARC